MRTAGALIFGVVVWCALVVGIGGHACTRTFSFAAGVYWLEVYTLFGVIEAVPAILLISAVAYFASFRLPSNINYALFIAIPIGLFAALLIFGHQSRTPCVYM